MYDLLNSILANALWTISGIIFVNLLILFNTVIPLKMLWSFKKPKELIVVTASSAIVDTGRYMRASTGIGQVRALALASTSLSKAYGQLSIQNIYLSVDQLQERIENDLLLLGGPKNNQISAKFMKIAEKLQPAMQVDGNIFWRKEKIGKWVLENAEKISAQVVNGQVITDYGLIIRMKSPFTRQDRTLILFSGIHTYGTTVAAKYFVEQFYRDFSLQILKKNNITAVVSAQIFGDHPVSLRLEKFYIWK